MCVHVLVVGKDGAEHYCENAGELAAALGVELGVLGPEVAAYGAEVCLCPVDIAAFGGRQATDAEGFPFPQFVITPKEPA